MSQATLAFIGAGNMASAIIGGLIANGYPADFILASDRTPANLLQLSDKYGIRTATSNIEAVHEAQVVVLAVKPQVLRDVCIALRGQLNHKPLIISIAAGVTLESMAEWLGKDMPIVRCMPNTPAMLQVGASGLYANSHASDVQQVLAEKILAAVGLVTWVDEESQLDAVTAVSGSGPAYFFMFMEAMAAAGEKLGLSAEQSMQLTIQTALGAARMAKESGLPPGELKRRVMSPKGTTEQAVQTFEQGGLHELTLSAMQACARRAEELAAEMKNL
ncbi:pyrroline-5-carboxylate reductase [Pokkaliibacter plantistimulans]|uniref:Pyrroline-5-carboxylate reductase n=1 Tax=Pokkaliibacter plantistimulans TaxID=1635171 RepID=A0ABX5M1G1_9GAMM|nr:pyrroline-5-carboxylate reductase [Pokkaliibacter plantistimulans]PXF32234.1 pyrroline-5-carboxylate reductase [Pokkaliibacter plantistimulans]